jgi:serine/threonine-protein kinase
MPDATALPSSEEDDGTLPPGSLLGDYAVVRAVGAGGLAVVYEAEHRALGRRVALKVPNTRHLGPKGDLSKRFVREAKNAARLHHPHVVEVSDVGVAHGVPYLVMELLEGEDLGAYLKRHGKLSVQAAADLIIPVVCAIDAAHEAGIIHRDLKPQNIFLCKARGSDQPLPKVVDFGMSKLLGGGTSAITAANAVLGTPFYMSPEQAMESKDVDGRTDQFALGVILYECLTGKRPFAGESVFTVLTAILHLDHVPLRSLGYPVAPEFDALVDRALQKKAAERFPTVQELGRELLRFASPRVQMQYAAELKATLTPALQKEAERLSAERLSTEPASRLAQETRPLRGKASVRGARVRQAKRPVQGSPALEQLLQRAQALAQTAAAGLKARDPRYLAGGAALVVLLISLLSWGLSSKERAPVPALPEVVVPSMVKPGQDTSDWAEPGR